MNNELFLAYGIDLRRRTILLNSNDPEESGVDAVMSDRVLKGLSLMTGNKPIILIINSHGGEDDHARAIIGAMRVHPAEIIGIVMGRAESAAAWIFQACDLRIMTTHSSIMLHMGESAKNKHSRYVDKLFVDDIYARMIEKDPEYPRNKLVNQLGDDWHIYPTQALELGLCDRVQTGPPEEI